MTDILVTNKVVEVGSNNALLPSINVTNKVIEIASNNALLPIISVTNKVIEVAYSAPKFAGAGNFFMMYW